MSTELSLGGQTYTRIRLLGSGSFLHVYLIQRRSKLLALKVPKGPDGDRCLRRELIMGLNLPSAYKHHIVCCDRAVLLGGQLTGLCRYVDGCSLKDLISSGQQLNPDRIESIFRQMLTALRYLHHKGLAHRDIKPANIMLDRSGRAYLIDLGLTTREASSRLCGTPKYLDPQMLSRLERGRNLSLEDLQRGDLYSLAATIDSMLPIGDRVIDRVLTRMLAPVSDRGSGRFKSAHEVLRWWSRADV